MKKRSANILPSIRILLLPAFVAGSEMIAIQIFSNHPDADLLSLLCVKKANEQFGEAASAAAEG